MKSATVNGEHRFRACQCRSNDTWLVAPSATLMFAPRPSFGYAMNATLGLMVAGVSSAVLQVLFTVLLVSPVNLCFAQVFRMLITAPSAHDSRKIVMAVQRL